MWIKAAVEHRILHMKYFSARTKGEVTVREVEPDFVGLSNDGKTSGMWATYCHLRNEAPRCFKQDSIMELKATEQSFTPSPFGRWKELIGEYGSRGLKSVDF